MKERPPLPTHPYRDSLLLSLFLAGLIVLVSWLTGGDAGRSVVFAIGFFVVSTAWSWWRFRRRLEEERRT